MRGRCCKRGSEVKRNLSNGRRFSSPPYALPALLRALVRGARLRFGWIPVGKLHPGRCHTRLSSRQRHWQRKWILQIKFKHAELVCEAAGGKLRKCSK
jgi:hypothetical protein